MCHPEARAQRASKGSTNTFIAQLFADKAKFLEDDPFRTIGEAAEFYTKAVGVSFEGRQDV
ncbi:MAG: hypothetical protein JOZ38_08185, partial [Candidatus Eremiobacteraeota bacterium]|nr:hypothetical protein [Candidatus Eremiobacteraeota bacterium]